MDRVYHLCGNEITRASQIAELHIFHFQLMEIGTGVLSPKFRSLDLSDLDRHYS